MFLLLTVRFIDWLFWILSVSSSNRTFSKENQQKFEACYCFKLVRSETKKEIMHTVRHRSLSVWKKEQKKIVSNFSKRRRRKARSIEENTHAKVLGLKKNSALTKNKPNEIITWSECECAVPYLFLFCSVDIFCYVKGFPWILNDCNNVSRTWPTFAWILKVSKK